MRKPLVELVLGKSGRSKRYSVLLMAHGTAHLLVDGLTKREAEKELRRLNKQFTKSAARAALLAVICRTCSWRILP
jgi:hypothetical protein